MQSLTYRCLIIIEVWRHNDINLCIFCCIFLLFTLTVITYFRLQILSYSQLGNGTSYASAKLIFKIQMVILIHFTNLTAEDAEKKRMTKQHPQKFLSNNARSLVKGLPPLSCYAWKKSSTLDSSKPVADGALPSRFVSVTLMNMQYVLQETPYGNGTIGIALCLLLLRIFFTSQLIVATFAVFYQSIGKSVYFERDLRHSLQTLYIMVMMNSYRTQTLFYCHSTSYVSYCPRQFPACFVEERTGVPKRLFR